MNEEFEKWARDQGFRLQLTHTGKSYLDYATAAAFDAWQASRKQALEAAAEACERSGSEFSRSDVNGRCGEHVYEDVAKDCAAAIRALQKD